ncbi:mitochondrial 37S ribosomal protein rsm10 [Aspergillus niger]
MALFLNSRLLKCTGRQFQLLAGFRGYSTFSDITHHAQPASDSLHPAASAESSALQSTELQTKQWRERLESINSKARLPRSVQAVYLRPLRRKAEFGLPVCDLQLRSYSVRNVEFFADFAVRAAYYLNLPVSGPVPLPRIVERWTVPRSNFVHKKSQENFERITLRRLVQIKDGNPQVVQTWLAFLRKHAFYGVGMKANVWEHESLGILLFSSRFVLVTVCHVTNDIVDADVAANMDSTLPEVKKTLEPYLSQFGQRQDATSHDSILDILDNERFVAYKGPLTTARKA